MSEKNGRNGDDEKKKTDCTTKNDIKSRGTEIEIVVKIKVRVEDVEAAVETGDDFDHGIDDFREPGGARDSPRRVVGIDVDRGGSGRRAEKEKKEGEKKKEKEWKKPH
jgi:hypothetical protein